MATEVQGVTPVRNLPDARVRVRFNNNGAIVGEAMDKLAGLARGFEEDANKRKAADLSASLNAEIAGIEFEAQRPDNATNAVQFFKDAAQDKIKSYDLSGLPIEYRNAVISEANESMLRSVPGLLKYQAGASLQADVAVDDKNFVVAESTVRQHGMTRGVDAKDFTMSISNVVASRDANLRSLFAGDMLKEKIDERSTAQKQKLWMSAIEEYATHNAAGAAQVLQEKIADGTILADEDTSRFMARIDGQQVSQSGVQAGTTAFIEGKSSSGRQAKLLSMGLPDKVHATAAAQLRRLEAAEKADRETREKDARKEAGAAIEAMADEYRAARRAKKTPRLLGSDNETKLAELEDTYTSLGMDPSEIREVYDKRVIEQSDIDSSQARLDHLKSLTSSQLANEDLDGYETTLSREHLSDWRAKQSAAKAKWQIPDHMARISKEAKKGSSPEKFESQVYRSFAVLAEYKGGYGTITEQEFAAVLAQTARAHIDFSFWVDPLLVDRTPEDAIELISKSGSMEQKAYLDAADRIIKSTPSLHLDASTRYAMFTYLSAGLTPKAAKAKADVEAAGLGDD